MGEMLKHQMNIMKLKQTSQEPQTREPMPTQGLEPFPDKVLSPPSQAYNSQEVRGPIIPPTLGQHLHLLWKAPHPTGEGEATWALTPTEVYRRLLKSGSLASLGSQWKENHQRQKIHLLTAYLLHMFQKENPPISILSLVEVLLPSLCLWSGQQRDRHFNSQLMPVQIWNLALKDSINKFHQDCNALLINLEGSNHMKVFLNKAGTPCPTAFLSQDFRDFPYGWSIPIDDFCRRNLTYPKEITQDFLKRAERAFIKHCLMRPKETLVQLEEHLRDVHYYEGEGERLKREREKERERERDREKPKRERERNLRESYSGDSMRGRISKIALLL